jgi:hypothetical protein
MWSASMPTRIARALVAALLLAAAAPAAFAQLVRIPRTNVAIAPPAGFKLAREFTGLENPDTGAKLTVTELGPEAYAELAASLASPKTASSKFASQGIRVTRIEQLTVGGTQAPFAIGGAEVRGQAVTKYLTVLGGAQAGARTVWVVVDVPDSASLRRGDVEAALQSIQIARLPTLDEKLARLPFRFEAHEPFKTADADQSGAVLTTTGKVADEKATAIVRIERGATSSTPREAAALNEQLLRRMSEFASAPIAERGATELIGEPAQFVVATSDELTAYQIVTVVPGGRYYRVFARVAAEEFAELREHIDAIAASVALPE